SLQTGYAQSQLPTTSFSQWFRKSVWCAASCMRTAKPSWRPPMTKSATTTLSGFGAQATSAKAPATSPQLIPIDSQARLGLIASSARRSAGETAADHGALLERLCWTTHLHDLARVDLVIESIVEELPVKRDFFGRLDDIVKEGAIFATNTSTLTVGDLASTTKRPERFIGLHFFNPVHAMKLVEVAPSLRTSRETVETCVAFAKQLGKTPVTVADSTGYIVNRLLVPYMV